MRFLAIFQKAVHHFSLFFLGFRKDVVRESPPGGGDTRKQRITTCHACASAGFSPAARAVTAKCTVRVISCDVYG